MVRTPTPREVIRESRWIAELRRLGARQTVTGAISELMAARSSRVRVARQACHILASQMPSPNDQVLVYDLELVEVQGESRSRFHSWHVSSHVEL